MQINNSSRLSSNQLDRLNKTILQTNNLLFEFANDLDFVKNIEIAFGNNYNFDTLEAIRQDLLTGDREDLPNLEILTSTEINNANAAFSIDTNTIYLSQEYLTEHEWDNSVIIDLLLEELGHWLDDKINAIDADGDEGEIFSNLLLGKDTGDRELATLKNEDDSASIILNGEVINIEQQLADNQQANTIFNHPNLKSDEILLLSKFALFSYYGNNGNFVEGGDPQGIDSLLSKSSTDKTLKDIKTIDLNKLEKNEVGGLIQSESLFDESELNNWEIITSQLGISPVNDIEVGDTYRKEVHRNRPLVVLEVGGTTTDTYGGIDGIVDADAFVAKRKSDGALVVSIRGTEFKKDNRDWLHKDEHYELFKELFAALDTYIQNNNPPKVYLTGHSLGGAMVDRFMAEHKGDPLYSAVTFASPEATFDKTDDRVLNIGYENDPVYSIVGTSDLFNSTTNFYVSLDSEHSKDEKGNDSGFLSEHSMFGYVYATSRILNSQHYSEMDRDSFITIDLTDDLEEWGLFDVFRLQSDNIFGSPDTFILGEDNRDDTLIGGRGDDLLEALGGNDSLVGDDGIFSGNDTLDGGRGNDTLNGGDGSDTAVFSDIKGSYTISPDYTVVTHNFSGERDTLLDIEILEFSDQTVSFYDNNENLNSFISTLDSYLAAIEAFLIGGSDDVPEEFKSTQNQAGTLATTSSNDSGLFEIELPLIGNSLAEAQDSLKAIQDIRGLIANEFKGEIALTAEQIASKLSEIPHLNVTKTSENSDEVIFALSLDISDRFSTELAPDLGQLEALGINIDGDASIDLGLKIEGLEFGVNDSGAFVTQNDSELEVSLGIGLPTAGLSAGLGCLGIDLHSTLPNSLDFSFDVPLDDFDYQLDFSQLNELEIFNFNLALPDLSLPGLEPISLPKINGGINLDFSELDNLNLGNGEELALPFSLDDIELDLGSFYDEFLRPITREIQDILEPLQPFLDVINQEIPGLSDFDSVKEVFDENDDGKVTVLDFAYYLDPDGGYEFLEELIAYNDFINSIPRDSGKLDLGKLIFDPDRVGKSDDGFDLELPSNYGSFKPNIPNRPDGFEIPLLDSPETVIPKLLLGETTDLITYTMPPLEFNSQFEQFFPLVGPLGVRFAGELGARAQFAFGFDTYGIAGCEAGFHGGDILQGFYVDDVYQGQDIPEANIYAGVFLEGGADFGVARGFVGGNLRGNVDFNLYDPNNDGKIRPNEFDPNPINLFDISANLTAGIQAWAEVGFKVFGKKITKRIIDESWGPFTLWSQELNPRPLDPNLGYVNAGTLLLNNGSDPSVAQGNTNNGDRSVAREQINDDYQISQSGDALALTGFGHRETFSGVTQIVAGGGVGNDKIELLANVNLAAEIGGGVGNDTIYGGTVNDSIAGGDGTDSLFGRDGADSLKGNDGRDTIFAGAGNDTVDGGADRDTIYGEAGNDTVDGGSGNDLLAGGDNNDFLQGQQGDDELYGEAGADTLYGGIGNDEVNGGSGNDSLEGQAGADTLYGGIGADVIAGGDDNDTIVGHEGDDNLDGEAGNDSIAGGAGNDLIQGSFGDDRLYGHQGNDTLEGGSGNDILNVYNYNGSNLLKGGSGDDSLYGGKQTDSMQGDTGADYLAGYEGNDTIQGGDGKDTVYGGLGNDSIQGNEAEDLLSGDEGADTILGGSGDDTIEGGAGNDPLLSGEAGNDLILGGADNDTIEGGADNDTIQGGDGIDSIRGDEGRDLIAGEANDDLIEGGAGDDTISGGSGIDSIRGNDGNDRIQGGTGDDVLLSGDAGNDAIAGNGGDDRIEGGTGDDTLIGNEGQDSLEGNEGRDLITGEAGKDSIQGGAGSDTLYGNEENDTVRGDDGDDLIYGGTGNDNIQGGADRDSIAGEAGSDLVQGNGGDDTLTGGTEADNIRGNAGADLIYGNAGNDTILGGDEADSIVSGVGEDSILGDNAGEIGNDLIYGGYDNDTIKGQNGADELYGEEGNDFINGGAQNDFIEGGKGDDLLNGVTGEDTIYGNEGNDTIVGSLGNDTLEGGAGNDSISGASENDSISGGAGNDTIRGGSGDDAIASHDGSDLIYGGDGIDSIQSGADDDFVEGGTENDTIEGGTGDDSLKGQQGDDSLVGEAGKDTLEGGDGRDVLQGGSDRDLLVGDETNDPNFAEGYDPAALITNYDDILEGGDGDDELYGYLGHDELKAGRGENWLEGGFGNDTLYGTTDEERLATPEGEIDRTVFALAPGSGRDIVYHFNPTEDVIYLSQGLTFAFLGIVGTTYEGEDSTNLIDLDTGDILATLVGIDPSQISRSNVDEENVPPNRLEFDSKKDYYATDETISLVDVVVRDANGIDDLETIDFWLRHNDGDWEDIADVGFKGIDGTAQWGDYDKDGDEDLLTAGINPKTGTYHTKIYNNNLFLKTNREDSEGQPIVEDGNGSFIEAEITLPTSWLNRMGWTWGDYDGDADLDLLGYGYVIENRGTDFTTGFSEDYIDILPDFDLIGDGEVEWQDYNGDGAIDILVSGSGIDKINAPDKVTNYTRIYYNDGSGNFPTVNNDSTNNFSDISNTDNIKDIRDDGTVTKINDIVAETDFILHSADWYDYNQDENSNIDLIVTGAIGTEENAQAITRIYNKNNEGNFSEASIEVKTYQAEQQGDEQVWIENTLNALPGVINSDVAWGKDNDGNVYLLITGQSNEYRTRAEDFDRVRIPISKIYRYDKDAQSFIDLQFYPDAEGKIQKRPDLLGVYHQTDGSHISLEDYDADGDLDITLTGRDFFDNPATIVYRNENDEFINAVFDDPASDDIRVGTFEYEIDNSNKDLAPGDYELKGTAYDRETASEEYTLIPGSGERERNKALFFDGIDDFVEIGNPEELQITGNQTIEMWIKPDNYDSRQNPYAKAYGGEGTITFEPDGNLSYYYGVTGSNSGANGSGYQAAYSNTILPLNRWSHIAVVRDFDAGKLYWYINGEKVSEYDTIFDAAIAGNEPLYLGNGYTNNFGGELDDVRVWNVARTEEEIQSNYNQQLTGNEAGLVAYWKFDEGDGSFANDSSSNNNNGAINGATFTDYVILEGSQPNYILKDTQQFNTSDDNQIRDRFSDGRGNAFISGETVSNDGTYDRDVWISSYQTDTEQWITQEFSTPSNERIAGRFTDSDGNTFIYGYTSGDLDGSGNYNGNYTDIWIAKYDIAAKQWIPQQFGTSSSDSVAGHFTNHQGNVFIYGSTQGDLDGSGSYTGNGSDIWIAGYDNFAQEWNFQQFGSPRADYPRNAFIGSQGKTFVYGITEGDLDGTGSHSGTYYDEDIWLAQFDEATQQLTSLQQFGSSSDDRVQGVFTDDLGNAFIYGTTEGDLDGSGSYSGSGKDIWVAGYDESTQQWIPKQFAISSDYNIVTFDTAIDSQGNAFVYGYSGGSDEDIWIASYDKATKQWNAQEFGSSSTDRLFRFNNFIDSQGNTFIYGYTYGDLDGTADNYTARGNDLWIARYNESTQQWIPQQFGFYRSDNSSGSNSISGSFTDSQGNIFTYGQSYGDLDNDGSHQNTIYDVWVSRYDEATQQWIPHQQFGSDSFDYVDGSFTDSEGNFFIYGRTTGDLDGSGSYSGTNYDVWVARYDEAAQRFVLDQFGSDAKDEISRGFITDSQGNTFIYGRTEGDLDGSGSYSGTGQDAWIARYDNSTQRWIPQQLGSDNDDYISRSFTDSQGNTLIYGTTRGDLDDSGSYSGTGQDAWIAHYDETTQQWIPQQFGSDNDDYHPFPIDDGINTIHLTGTTYESSYYVGDADVFSAKIDIEDTKERFILGDSESSFYGTSAQATALVENFQDEDQIQLHGSDLQYHFAIIQVATDGSVSYVNDTDTSIDEANLLTPDLVSNLAGKTATAILYSATGWTNNNGVATSNGEPNLIGVVAGVESLKKTTQAEEGNVVFVSERNDFTEKTSFTVNTNGTSESEALAGSNGRDIFTGGDGDDTIISYQGSDYIDGGTGEDILIGTTDELLLINQSVRWSDYDNDGDEDILLLDSQNDDREITQVYRNNGESNPEGIVSFTYLDNLAIAEQELPEGLSTGVSYHLWGEGNNGDRYVFYSDPNTNQIYLEDGTPLGEENWIEDNNEDPFIDLKAHSFDWGDYNNDGDIDFVVTGEDASGIPTTRVYRGDGNANFTKQDNFNFDDVLSGDAEWGDYDGDGDEDLIIIGKTLNFVNNGTGFEVVEEAIAKLYQYDSANNTFVEDSNFFDLTELNIDPETLNLNHTSPVDYLDWADYDRDGKQDLILSDRSTTTQIYRNHGDRLELATTPFFDDTSVSDDENLIFGWEDNDQIWGGSGDDTIKAKSGDDTVQGGTGNDTIYGGEGADLIDGGNDIDVLTYQNDPNGVSVDLTAATATDGYDNTDTIVKTAELSSIENAIASEYGDAVVGDSQDNQLIGLAGDDSLAGEGGDDTLVGGFGKDTIEAGEGNDLIQSGSGQDDLQGGAGNDEYVLIPAITTLQKTDGSYPEKVYLTLEEAFTALGGGHKQQGKITRPSNNFEINWDTFTRWNFDAEYDKFEEFGFEVDRNKRDAGEDSWLRFEPRQALAGTQITDTDGTDELILPNSINIDLERLYPGKTGLAQVGKSLVIDLNQDGVAIESDDIYIHNFFNSNGYGEGAGFIETVGNLAGKVILKLAEAFTPIEISLPEYSDTQNWSGFTTWGDYDDDGDLDAFVSGEDDLGNGFSKIYQNTGKKVFIDGIFTNAVDLEALERVEYAKWGDYDNDGDLDLLLFGHDNLPLTDDTEQPAREYFARVYRNNHLENKENGDGEDIPFTVTESISLGQVDKADVGNIDLPAVDWADYDNDGDLDILTTDLKQDLQSTVTPNWVGQFGSDSFDLTRAIASDSLGNAVLTGYTYGDVGDASVGNSDAWIAKYDENGNQLWVTQFGSDSSDFAEAIVTDSQGNTFIAGNTNGDLDGTNAGSADAWIAKYDENGEEVWLTQFGTADYEYTYGMATDTLGNTFIAGNTSGNFKDTNSSNYIEDAWIAKYDENGKEVWLTQFGTADYDTAQAIATDSQGNIFVTGNTNGDLDGTNAGGEDAWIAKYDENGEEVWLTQFGTADYDTAQAIAIDSQGNIFVTGNTNGDFDNPGNYTEDAWLAKYNENGEEVWLTQFGTTEYDSINDLTIDSQDNIILAGNTYKNSNGSGDAWIVKYDSDGNQIGIQQFGTTDEFEDISGITADSQGHILLSGYTYGSLASTNAGGGDAWVAQLTDADAFYSDSVNFYRNDGEEFTVDLDNQLANILSNLTNTSVDSIDYNNDGILDVFVTGRDTSDTSFNYEAGNPDNINIPQVSKLYQGQADGSYSEVELNIEGIQNATTAWGDYNNDGYFDVAIAGERQVTGNALEFDGFNDYVEIPDSDAIDFDTNDSFTVEAWIQADSYQTDTANSDNDIIEKWSGGEGYPFVIRYSNQTHTNSGKISVARYDGSKASGVTSQSTINDGEFHHVAFVKDGDLLHLYIDGVLEGSTLDKTEATTKNTSPLYIGSRGNFAGDRYNFFEGAVDDVRIWNKARTKAEINADMNRVLEGDEAGLVGNWNFDAIAGSTVKDLSSNNNDGTVYGAYSTTGVEQDREVTQLYQNNLNDSDATIPFSIQDTNLTNLSDPALSWGDYNNDGNLDLLATGTNNHQPVTEIYQGDGAGNFTILENDEFLTTSIQNGEATWGDYDGDGDLDLAVTGAAGSDGVPFAQVYRNNIVQVGGDSSQTDEQGNRLPKNANQSPNAPDKLLPKYNKNSVTLRWNPTTDVPTPENNKTPQDALTYNLRIGTSTGGVDVLSPGSGKTKGERQIATVGNVGFATQEVINDEIQSTLTWTVNDLDYGETYYWNVQAIDGGLQASQWDSEANFTVNFVDWSEGEVNSAIALPDKLGQDFINDPNNLSGIAVVDFEVGDYNNDGKLDLVVAGQDLNNNNDGSIQIYQGTSVTDFIWDDNDPVTQDFANTTFKDISLGDFNSYQNDGSYLDLLLVAELNNVSQNANFSGVYLNQNGSFDFSQDLIEIGNTIENQTHTYSQADFGDYDYDGDLDILLAGAQKSVVVSNDRYSYSNGYKTSIGAQLRHAQREVLDTNWADYDNDGDLDVILSFDAGSDTDPRKATEFYSNETYISTNDSSQSINTFFSRVLSPANEGAVEHIGQYNNEGALDFILDDGEIYANKIETENQAPTAPTELDSVVENDDRLIIFSWSPANDSSSNSSGLTYELRVGSTPGGSDIVAPISIDGRGNAQTNTSWQLNIDKPDGLYYWSVRAVDPAFAVSEFATEGTFYLGERESTTPQSNDIESIVELPEIPPTLAINDLIVREGNETTEAVVTVSLNVVSEETISVDYATNNDTATSGSDYTAASGTLTFAPGETSKDIAIAILGDDLEEELETFSVTLSNAVNANLEQARSVITIENDDRALSDLTIVDSSLKILDADSQEVTTIQRGDIFSLEWQTDNNGEGDTFHPPYFQTYLSEDNTLDDEDLFLGDLQGETTLAAASSEIFTQELQIVEEEVGDRHLIVVVDPEYEQTLDNGEILVTGNEPETNENNNIVNKAIEITEIPDAETVDLAISNGAIDSTSDLNPSVSWDLTNSSQQSVDNIVTYMYLSGDRELDGEDIQVSPDMGNYFIENADETITFDRTAFLADNGIAFNSNQTRSLSKNINISNQTGDSQYLLLFASAESDLLESNIEDNLEAIPISSTSNGSSNDDLLVGGWSVDTIAGNDGNDILKGDRGNDVLNGGSGDDLLLGQNDDDVLSGGAGNDTLRGNNDDDILIGVDASRDNPGSGEIDVLFGDEGNDTFVLGNSSQAYYQGNGNSDYARIIGFESNELDFQSERDVIELYGDRDNYLLKTNNTNTSILYGESGSTPDELIGVVIGVTGLELDSSQFRFVEHLALPQILIGTDDDDTLIGGTENDSLRGRDGDDSLVGNAGNDTIKGEAGNDFIDGGDGNDSLWGNAGDDTISGGSGSDRLIETSDKSNILISDTQLNAEGADIIEGIEFIKLTAGDSDNSINAFTATAIATTIDSQGGNDVIRGGAAKDIVNGGDGNDTIFGNAGNDNIKGGTGDDSLRGGTENDTLFGQDGADLLRGEDGNDSLNGGAGDDTLFGTAGNDTIVGGSGYDVLIESNDLDFTLTNNSLTGNGTDTIFAIQQVKLTGGNSDNSIDASAVTNIPATILSGGMGNDTLLGGAKQDTLKGGAGNDSLNGGDLRDILFGGTGNDAIAGMAGNDVLKGESGNDTLDGGAGYNVLTGGAGSDIFIVEALEGRDVITDFEDGIDRFALGSSLSFEALKIRGNAAGTVAAIRLESNNEILTIVQNINPNDLTTDDFL